MENIFCGRCHRLTAQIKRGDGGIKVIQNGKTLISMGKGGGNSILVKCPAGHSVKIEVGNGV